MPVKPIDSRLPMLFRLSPSYLRTLGIAFFVLLAALAPPSSASAAQPMERWDRWLEQGRYEDVAEQARKWLEKKDGSELAPEATRILAEAEYQLLLMAPPRERVAAWRAEFPDSPRLEDATELESKLLGDGVIEPHQVEGRGATKTFEQYRVSLDWDRDPDESFWVSMLVLVNKPWLTPQALRAMADSKWLRKNHKLLARFAEASNRVHMAGFVPSSIMRGEIGWRVIRRFWTPGKFVTS